MDCLNHPQKQFESRFFESNSPLSFYIKLTNLIKLITPELNSEISFRPSGFTQAELGQGQFVCMRRRADEGSDEADCFRSLRVPPRANNKSVTLYLLNKIINFRYGYCSN